MMHRRTMLVIDFGVIRRGVDMEIWRLRVEADECRGERDREELS
jgi:hypothetical protein